MPISELTLDRIFGDFGIRTPLTARNLANTLRTVTNAINRQIRNRTLTSSRGRELLDFARNHVRRLRSQL